MHTNKALLTAWRFQQAVNSSLGFHPRGETGHQHQSSSSHQCTKLYKTTLCLFPMEEHWMCFTASFHDTLCFCRQSVTTWEASSTVFSCTFTKRSFTAPGQTNLPQTKKTTTKQTLSDTTEPWNKNIRSQLITFFRSNYFPFFYTNTSRADLHMNRSAELWQKRLPVTKKYCLSWSKRGNLCNQPLPVWLRWLLIYTCE